MYKSKFSVRSLDATANLTKTTQTFDFFSPKFFKGCRLATAFTVNGNVVVEFLHVTALT